MAKNLRWLRNLEKLTQTQVAKRIGVQRTLYASWEDGRSLPQTDDLRRISLMFWVSIDYLVRKDLSLIHLVEIRQNFNIIQSQLAEIDRLNERYRTR